MKLLLDTCTFLWIVNRQRAFADHVLAALAAPENEVSLSAASVWEIAVKHARGRLPLPAPLERFVPHERNRYGIALLPVDEDAALHVAKLPPLHLDPFDRMLVSQAIVHGMTIVTPDPAVTQYPARTMW
jgi:PIN domain nuclease of toxin-antitoxin system